MSRDKASKIVLRARELAGKGEVDRQDQDQEDRERADLHDPEAAYAVIHESEGSHAASLQAGAAVRTHARSLADRALGLAASSASPAVRAPLKRSSKLGAGPSLVGGR